MKRCPSKLHLESVSPLTLACFARQVKPPVPPPPVPPQPTQPAGRLAGKRVVKRKKADDEWEISSASDGDDEVVWTEEEDCPACNGRKRAHTCRKKFKR